jgi:hypothetical protein
LIYRTLIKGQFAPTEQKKEQTLSRAREEKVTIVLFRRPDHFGEMVKPVLLQPGKIQYNTEEGGDRKVAPFLSRGSAHLVLYNTCPNELDDV